MNRLLLLIRYLITVLGRFDLRLGVMAAGDQHGVSACLEEEIDNQRTTAPKMKNIPSEAIPSETEVAEAGLIYSLLRSRFANIRWCEWSGIREQLLHTL